ncbi:MAG: rod-binding protein [Desulfobacterales bacterium]
MKLAFDPQVMYPKTENLKHASCKNDRKALNQLCQDFESVFINSLFQEMRKSVPDEGYLENDMGMDLFQEMMDMEVAREMSNRGGLGLGKLLYEQLQNKQGNDDA